MRYVIGCDVGTQGLKAILWREGGTIVGTRTASFPINYPRQAWAEQGVHHWWDALVKVIQHLRQEHQVSRSRIVAIGVDGTVDGFVPVSRSGAPLGPHLLWMDRRATDECRDIEARIDPQELFRITGLNLDASHTAAKMLWLRNNRPDMYRDAWQLMPSTTYVVYRLTGTSVVDYSHASSTMLFDVRTREWSARLLDLLDISPDVLPEVRPATDVTGTLTAEAAEALDLDPGTLVAVGCGDEHAACVGAGVMEPGIVADIIGTAEPVCASARQPAFDSSHLVETHCHAHPERWLLENPGFVSGGNYRWFRDLLRTNGGSDGLSHEALNREAAAVPAGSEGVIFLPAMMGAMAPEWNNNARGVFYGLTLGHSRGHILRALLEGAGYAVRSIIDSMRNAGVPVNEIRAVAGGSRSPLIRQIRADVTGVPVAVLTTSETTAVGAALLAAVAAGIHTDLEDAARETTHVVEVHEPNPQNQAIYEQAYVNFLMVYNSLTDCFDACVLP